MQTIAPSAQDQTSRQKPARLPVVGGLLAAVGVILVMAGMIYDWFFPDSAIFGTNNDFANYWIAGRLVIEGRTDLLFSGHDAYFSYMQSVFGPDYPWHSWSYPPSFLLLVWPLGLLGFDAAANLFQGTSLALLFWAMFQARKTTSPAALLLLLPFLLVNLAVLQNGFLTAGLMLAGLNHRERAPLLAGFFFGLLTIKPQLGLLLPLLLIAEQNWRAIASACVTALCMIVLSALLFGTSAWTGYFGPTMSYQVDVMNEFGGDFLGMMPSLFGTLRHFGADAGKAMWLHAALALPVLLAYLVGLAKIRDADARAQMMVLSTFLLSPYALFYDFGAMCALAASQIRLPSRNDFWTGMLKQTVLVCIVVLPVVAYVAIATKTSFVYVPILLAGLIVCWLPGNDRESWQRPGMPD